MKQEILDDYLLYVSLQKKIYLNCFISAILYTLVGIVSLFLYNNNFSSSYYDQNILIYSTLILGIISIIIAIIMVLRSIYTILYIDNITVKQRKRMKTANSLFDNIGFFFRIFIIIFFIVSFVITPAEVEGISMQNTFDEHDKIMVYHLTRNYNDNDVVIINAANYFNDELIIKRVVAKEGDIVSFDSNNYLIVNGNKTEIQFREHRDLNGVRKSVDEIIEMIFGKKESQMVVPDNKYLVIGDNYYNSIDSRYIGLIDYEDILGKCVFRFYPFNKMGVIGDRVE